MHSRSHCSGTRGAAPAHPVLASLTWRDFERLIGEEFRRRGFIVTGFGGGIPGGSGRSVDLALMRKGERFLVECKQWRKQQVDVTVVRDLGRIIRAAGASGGYLFTGGEFTCEARELARCTRIELIDGALLRVDWLRSARSPESALAPLAPA
ncbi:MAG: restriction endonuclease [Steroidobacteraceae bacterium]|jgi:restriction system protein